MYFFERIYRNANKPNKAINDERVIYMNNSSRQNYTRQQETLTLGEAFKLTTLGNYLSSPRPYFENAHLRAMLDRNAKSKDDYIVGPSLKAEHRKDTAEFWRNKSKGYKKIYYNLLNRVKGCGEFGVEPYVAEIAREVNLSPRQVQRIFVIMEQDGVLVREFRRDLPNRYRIYPIFYADRQTVVKNGRELDTNNFISQNVTRINIEYIKYGVTVRDSLDRLPLNGGNASVRNTDTVINKNTWLENRTKIINHAREEQNKKPKKGSMYTREQQLEILSRIKDGVVPSDFDPIPECIRRINPSIINLTLAGKLELVAFSRFAISDSIEKLRQYRKPIDLDGKWRLLCRLCIDYHKNEGTQPDWFWSKSLIEALHIPKGSPRAMVAPKTSPAPQIQSRFEINKSREVKKYSEEESREIRESAIALFGRDIVDSMYKLCEENDRDRSKMS